MALLVDDLLSFPVQLFEIIFNTVLQSAYKGTWADYKRQLNIALIRLHRSYAEGKISRKEMRRIESKIFMELRLANNILESAPMQAGV